MLVPAFFAKTENMHQGYLRCYLLRDGRDECAPTDAALLPAAGALFLTDYRVVFKGQPCAGRITRRIGMFSCSVGFVLTLIHPCY